jgi:hypothetical protein
MGAYCKAMPYAYPLARTRSNTCWQPIFTDISTKPCARFLAEGRRVAERVLVIDAAWRDEVQCEEVHERVLLDGSRHWVYKRYFRPAQLAEELGAARVVHAGRWFVAAMA